MTRNAWVFGALLVASLVARTGTAASPAAGTGPWNVKELQKAPKFQITDTQKMKEKTSDGEVAVQLSTLYYDGEPWMGKPTRVFAYLARPVQADDKKLPAMVLVHGGGGTAFPEWARIWAARGYVALAMDLSGCGPERKRLPDGGPDQSDESKFFHMKDGIKNVWSYYAVAEVIRGISLLKSLPDVDGKRLGITGISWGGYLTNLVMSLDDRLKVAVPVYGCGFLHENSVWLPAFAKMPEDERKSWIENFDPSRYLARCKIPVLWMNGTNDFAYPLDSYQKSYRAASGPRLLCITVKMPHGHEAGWARPEIYRFVDTLLRPGQGEPGIAAFGKTEVEDGKLKVAYDSPSTAAKIEINWTTDLDNPWQQREWKTRQGSIRDLHQAEVTLPTERPAVYFLTLTDVRGGVSSSEHETLGVAKK